MIGIDCGCKLVVGQTNVKSCYSSTSPLHYTSCLNLEIGQAAAYSSCTSFVVLHPVNSKFDLHQIEVSSSFLSRVMNNHFLLGEEQPTFYVKVDYKVAKCSLFFFFCFWHKLKFKANKRKWNCPTKLLEYTLGIKDSKKLKGN